MTGLVKIFVVIVLGWTLISHRVVAGPSAVTVNFGPPGLGMGGPNPISLPPRITEIGFTYLSSSSIETRLAITGLHVGRRWMFKSGTYVTLGGGLVVSANGSGFGLSSAFGIDFRCGVVCYNAEYATALGITSSHIISPYAIRLGVSLWL